MNIGLSTSFTGEDSLDVTIDVGGSATTGTMVQVKLKQQHHKLPGYI